MELKNDKILKQKIENIDKQGLTHHGVMGMKWGIRKDPNSGRAPGKKFKELNKSFKKVVGNASDAVKKYKKASDARKAKRTKLRDLKAIEERNKKRGAVKSARDLAKDIPKLNDNRLKLELERITLENKVLEQAVAKVSMTKKMSDLTTKQNIMVKSFDKQKQQLVDKAMGIAMQKGMGYVEKNFFKK